MDKLTFEVLGLGRLGVQTMLLSMTKSIPRCWVWVRLFFWGGRRREKGSPKKFNKWELPQEKQKCNLLPSPLKRLDIWGHDKAAYVGICSAPILLHRLFTPCSFSTQTQIVVLNRVALGSNTNKSRATFCWRTCTVTIHISFKTLVRNIYGGGRAFDYTWGKLFPPLRKSQWKGAPLYLERFLLFYIKPLQWVLRTAQGGAEWLQWGEEEDGYILK